MNDTSAGDIDAALANCASEPVHIPSFIQGNGAIVAVDNETLTLTHASANLEQITGVPHATALNQSIYDVFPEGLRHDLVNSLLPPFLMQETRPVDSFELNGRTLIAGASAAGPATIFEFEPIESMQVVTGKAVHQLAFLTSQLQNVDNTATLFEKSVRLLQVLTGFDRVMVYEFDGDGNGKIQAEALTGPLEPYLGLNFPAWDIPQQARDIMRKTPFRYIADVLSPSVPIHAGNDDAAPLDMTFSHLRGVSPVHIRYLENMGSGASFTLNVVVSGQLWGMISMHHPTARVPDQTVREVCRNFVRFFGLTLDTMLQRERLTRLYEADTVRRELTESAAGEETETLLSKQLLTRLCDAMRADGAVLVKEGSVQSHGLVPPPDRLEQLMQFGVSCPDTFHTSALGADNPELVDMVGDEIAGLHITFMAENSFVAFFRRDRELVTKWAGAPQKTIEGQGADARLQPRGSFAEYKETVRGSSIPWTAEEHQIAGEVWSILVSAEREALIKKTTRQQKMLIDELNHRVRNILTLIRSLSRQSQSTSDTIDDFIVTLEDRIVAVANAHSLAVEKPEAYVSIRTILKLEAEPHSDGGERIRIRGDDVGLRPDVAPIFALVLHELMTNAAKYGALSEPGGRLTIELEPCADGLALRWTETGGPRVATPKRKGFGTRLVNNAVPNELKGSIEIDYRETGLFVNMVLPEDLLSGLRSFGHQTGASVEASGDGASELAEYEARADVGCLLVEDSFVISMDTLRILNDVGFVTIRTSMTVQDGMAAIKAERPDFAVLDVNLSGGETSLGIARHLKELGTPFVFVTGYGVDGVSQDQFPGVPVIQKPLRRASLEQALRDIGM
ncbi:HWE histidine kinase domain-containing protein [Tateyamaria armeniaca]|uniref:histidine kinase n=1 Tax=Tateyamaria armeniaca TaxID=2518930 RepID=A0ABW8UXH2_9RHOB